IRTLSILAVALLATAAFAQAPATPPAAAPTPAMTVSTSAYPDGGQIPVAFTQAAPGVAAGEGVSFPITWANAPAGTKGFVVHLHDMDVARNKTTEDQL